MKEPSKTSKKSIEWTDAAIRTLTLDKVKAMEGLYNPVRVAICLYLLLDKAGGPGKWWVFRFKSPEENRVRDMGLGRYGKAKDELTLAGARERAGELRKLVKDGIDPINEKIRLKQGKAISKVPTFAEVATKFIDTHAPGWRNDKHVNQWRNTMRDYANPVIGDLPVNVITTDHVLAILEGEFWTKKTETAKRVQGRIEKVMDFAKARKWRTGDNPARWKGHLDTMLPKPGKVKKVRHHKSLPYSQIFEFMTELKARQGISARALELCILTATRTKEVIGAEWSEFDLQAGTWTIPGQRMKAGKPHRVPLSKPALAVLEAQKGMDDRWVFPGVKDGQHLSNMAMLELLKEMEKPVTVHGFRSSFRNFAAEQTSFPREIAEAALAHTNRDKTEAAYLSSDHLAKRTALMEQWATHCATKPTKGKVVPLKAAS